MRILGIDYGDKRIGLALSDPLGVTSQPLGFYERRSKKQDAEYFSGLVSEYHVSRIVVGLPLNMDGTEGSRAEKTRKFAEWLKNALSLPVVFWDERLTTKEALMIMRDKQVKDKNKKSEKDKIAASLILSSYLESRR
jgi:putative Holliday junction resolvase